MSNAPPPWDSERGERMAHRNILTPKAQRDIEDEFNNRHEAFVLLDLIDSEFRSDPTSVQCFDSRIVQRVRECVEKHKEFLRRNPLMD